MKFTEIAQKLKEILLEMADTKSEAIDYLHHLAKPYTQHICKLMLWGKQNDIWSEDWFHEIWNFVSDVDDIILKGNRRLKPETYKKEFFIKYFEDQTEFIERLKQVKKRFVDKEGYPKADDINIEIAYKNYLMFVDEVLKLMTAGVLYQDSLKELCIKYI